MRRSFIPFIVIGVFCSVILVVLSDFLFSTISSNNYERYDQFISHIFLFTHEMGMERLSTQIMNKRINSALEFENNCVGFRVNSSSLYLDDIDFKNIPPGDVVCLARKAAELSWQSYQKNDLYTAKQMMYAATCLAPDWSYLYLEIVALDHEMNNHQQVEYDFDRCEQRRSSRSYCMEAQSNYLKGNFNNFRPMHYVPEVLQNICN